MRAFQGERETEAGNAMETGDLKAFGVGAGRAGVMFDSTFCSGRETLPAHSVTGTSRNGFCSEGT